MRSRGAKRSESGTLMIKAIATTDSRNAGATLCPREAWSEHRLAQVTIMTSPFRQPLPLGLLRTGKPLLSSVVQAWNSKGEQLQGRSRRCLMIIDSTSGKPQLLTVDMIMIVEHRHQLVAQIAMGA